MNRAWLTVAAALLLGSSVVQTQQDDRPTLSVLAFAASRGLISSAETAELADDLAGRLVETGRFRVLPREWLVPEQAEPSELAALREAARHAGVRYLVSASVTSLSGGHSPTPMALSGAARAIFALRGARRAPIPCPSVRPRQSSALVETRVIDTDTGDIVRTSVIRVRLAIPTGLTPGCARGAAVPVAALVASRSRTEIDNLKSANQDIANHLVLPEQERPANP